MHGDIVRSARCCSTLNMDPVTTYDREPHRGVVMIGSTFLFYGKS